MVRIESLALRMKLVLLLVVVGFIAGCAATQQMSTNNDDRIKNVAIIFDGNQCPSAVDPNGPIEISKANGEMIRWQAVDTSGGPLPVDFDIYFDPFKGKSLNSTTKGWVKSAPVDSDTPVNVEFKYTIVASECLGSPLDPRIKIL